MSDTDAMDANLTDVSAALAAAPDVVDPAGTPPGTPSGGGVREDETADDADKDLVEDEEEDSDEDEPIEADQWVQFSRKGLEGAFLGKMKEDYAHKSKSGKHWMCEIRLYKDGEFGKTLTLLRDRITHILDEDEKTGEPIPPSDSEEANSGDDDDDSEDEQEKKAKEQKAKEKKEKKEKKAKEKKEKKAKKEKPAKTITKRTKRAQKKGVTVDHEQSCRDARKWSAEQLKLDTYKEMETVTEPEVVRSGEDDALLKKLKDDPSGHDFPGYSLFGRILMFAEQNTSDIEGRNQLASILVMMLTSKHDQYKDVKGLMKFVGKMAPYNVQGHLCEDVFRLDFKCKEQREYVHFMYAKLTELISA